MKKLVLAFLVVMLASAFGASVDVQESLPATTVWSFSVKLPGANDFDEAKVWLDGSSLISFYTYNGKIKFDSDDVDKSRVFSNTEPIDNMVYFLVSPMEDGIHEIELEVDGDVVDSEEVDFFEIYDAEDKASLQQQISTVKGSVATLIEQYNQLEASLGSYLKEEDRQALQSGIDGLQASLENLEAAVEGQEQQNSLKFQVLADDIAGQRAVQSSEAQGSGTGFVSLGSLNQEYLALAAAFVAAAVAVFLLVKFRNRLPLKKGLYGKPKQGEMGFSQRDEEITSQVLEESQDERKGKWAFGDSASKPPREEKRFNIGDLIRK
jgi:hypothetical protein